MDVLALILSIVALTLAAMAFSRSGGMRDVRRQLDTLSAKAGGARELAADTIDKLEDMVRGGEKPTSGEESSHRPTTKAK